MIISNFLGKNIVLQIIYIGVILLKQNVNSEQNIYFS